MSINQQIGAQIRLAKTIDPNLHIGDFQVRVESQGAVLINLRTGEARLLFEDGPDDLPKCESITQ